MQRERKLHLSLRARYPYGSWSCSSRTVIAILWLLLPCHEQNCRWCSNKLTWNFDGNYTSHAQTGNLGKDFSELMYPTKPFSWYYFLWETRSSLATQVWVWEFALHFSSTILSYTLFFQKSVLMILNILSVSSILSTTIEMNIKNDQEWQGMGVREW